MNTPDIHFSELHRLGQAQREIEPKLDPQNISTKVNKKKLSEYVLKVSKDYILSFRSFEYLEKWAFNKAGI